MTDWIDEVIAFIGLPNAVEGRREFVLDGCRIDLRSLPEPSVILSVPHLQGSASPINRCIGGNERCDLVVLAAGQERPTVIFVEAKSGNDRDYRDSEKAVSQLKSSYSIFLDAFDAIDVELPFNDVQECDVRATCVMESIRSNLGASITQRALENEFYRETRVPFRYTPAEADIWQTIQNSTT